MPEDVHVRAAEIREEAKNADTQQLLNDLLRDTHTLGRIHLSPCRYTSDCEEWVQYRAWVYCEELEKRLNALSREVSDQSTSLPPDNRDLVIHYLAEKLAGSGTQIIGMMAETLSRGLRGEEVDDHLDRDKHLEQLTQLWIAQAESEVGVAPEDDHTDSSLT